MTVDYSVIRADNKEEYGRAWGRLGPLLLSNRYDDQTHFLFELLQNAEDAISRRPKGWTGPRTVSFVLGKAELAFSHFGEPFSEADVRGICGIALSTKSDDLNTIGRFGIGFKSVYAYTDTPFVHSGEHHFAIEDYVLPREVKPAPTKEGQTLFLFPLRPTQADAFDTLRAALENLGTRSLLFLKQIDEVQWNIPAANREGRYLRERTKDILRGCDVITVLGQVGSTHLQSESFAVFGRSFTDTSAEALIEVAFKLEAESGGSRPPVIEAAADCTVVAFFPTVKPTHTGFILQGPFRTTPSRDNIPRDDPWNDRLIVEASRLLGDALRGMRETGMLTASALSTLPLNSSSFSKDRLLEPLFFATKELFRHQELIPTSDGQYARAAQIRLARSQDLRELFNSSQLQTILGEADQVWWANGEITADRFPELRNYLIRELGIAELRVEDLISRITAKFLLGQSDDWIARLYSFMAGQTGIMRQNRLKELAWLRLECGEHVPPTRGDKRLAFLPSSTTTDFPTIRGTVCSSPEALSFLKSLGVTEPDPVDDIVSNILPRYAQADEISDSDYIDHIDRFTKAYQVDSRERRETLIRALRETPFVACVSTGNGSKTRLKPRSVYLATERLKCLFHGVLGVFIVDEDFSVLSSEKTRDLLEVCGVARHVDPVEVGSELTSSDLEAIEGLQDVPRATSRGPHTDYKLRGLDELLDQREVLTKEEWGSRAAVLWESLRELLSRRGRQYFTGTYRWRYYSDYQRSFPAWFMRTLSGEAWVPAPSGVLVKPSEVCIEDTSWMDEPLLTEMLGFVPPALRELADKIGLELDVLTALTSADQDKLMQIKKLLGMVGEQEASPETLVKGGEKDATSAASLTPGNGSEPKGSASPPSHPTQIDGGIGGRNAGSLEHADGAPPFISYVAVSTEELNDGQETASGDHEELLRLEELAIVEILKREPNLLRAPRNQAGFDLYEPGSLGGPVRWIEVKAMSSSLLYRSVALSHTQFSFATAHGDRFWLYIVENVGSAEPTIARIRNPAGRAKSFTFDRGWSSVAERI
jgi:hypothetical protein